MTTRSSARLNKQTGEMEVFINQIKVAKADLATVDLELADDAALLAEITLSKGNNKTKIENRISAIRTNMAALNNRVQTDVVHSAEAKLELNTMKVNEV